MGVLSADVLFEHPFNVGIGVDISSAPPAHVSASTGPDNGSVAGMRHILKAQRQHGSSEEVGKLFDWDDTDQPQFITLLGHGAAGIFDVGDGQTGDTMTGSLANWNRSYWAEHLERVSRFVGPRDGDYNHLQYSGGLLLLGCCVAAGQAGADLMKALADTSHRIVFAYTGLVSVKNGASIWYEKGHAWLRQEPLTPTPVVVARPVPPQLLRKSNLRGEGLPEGMEAADVASIVVTRTSAAAEPLTLPPQEAPVLFAHLFYSRAFAPPGDVPGRLTHALTIHYRNQPPLKVDVIASRLAQTDAGMTFLCGPGLADYLERLHSA